MTINENSIAAANAASVVNVPLQAESEILARKILLIGTGDPAYVNGNERTAVRSAEEVAALTGVGYMLHRKAIALFNFAHGTAIEFIQQQEAAGDAADGSIDFATSAAVLAGTLALYISNDRVPVAISVGATPDEIATAVVAAIQKYPNLPITAEVDGAVLSQVNFTSKSKGPFGNDISLSVNNRKGETLPFGVGLAIVEMTGGNGVPIIQTVLDDLGTGDAANEDHYTAICASGYGSDATTLDAIANYVGQGNTPVGLYSKTVKRPFRALFGDNAPEMDGLDALIVISDQRKNDRSQGVLCIPGSLSHPAEFAAAAIGDMEHVSSYRAEEPYTNRKLYGFHPGAAADRWTKDYDVRDLAVKSGISPTMVEDNTVLLQNVVSFFRPIEVPVKSNAYRSMRNIAIIQNMLDTISRRFRTERWTGTSIVKDVLRVKNVASRKKAKSVSLFLDELISIASAFEERAWIFDADYTIDALAKPGAVVLRENGSGFDAEMEVRFSGVGDITDVTVKMDTSLAGAV